MSLPFTPRLPPLPYQLSYLLEHGHEESWGLIWDPGTGKSKAVIDNAALLLCENKIDAMLVLAPNGPHRGWAIGTPEEPSELEKHWPHDAPAAYEAFVWESWRAGQVQYTRDWNGFLACTLSNANKNPSAPFGVLCMSYDSLMTDAGKQASWDFLRSRRCLYLADESQRFKEPSSKRNRRVYASSQYAPYRRIASGTPADKPFDVYPQLRFLDPDFWKRTMGIESVAAFRAHLGNWQKRRTNAGRYFDVLDQDDPYRNLDELEAVLKTRTTRLTEEQAELHLPAKVYHRIEHDLTEEQRQAWDELKEECLTQLPTGQLVTAEHVLTLRTRLMQIGCGFVTPQAGAEPVPFARNPRAEAAADVLRGLPPGEPTLGWGLFTHDCLALAEVSRSLGRRPVIFDAGNTAATVDAWKRGQFDDLIAQLGSGMTEFYTLNRACHMLYFSNTPRLISRQQSEKRVHRIGQTREVHYYDFLARGTNDEANLEAVRRKGRWVGMSLGDDPNKMAAWLRASLTGDLPDEHGLTDNMYRFRVRAPYEHEEQLSMEWGDGGEYERAMR